MVVSSNGVPERDFSREAMHVQGTPITRVRCGRDHDRVVSFTVGENLVQMRDRRFRPSFQEIPSPGGVRDVAFGGNWLAVASGDLAVSVYDTRSDVWATAVFRLGPLPQPVRRLAISPDGSRLAASCDDGAIHLWALVADTALEVLSIRGEATTGLAFSPSGQSLAAAGMNDVVILGALPRTAD